MLVHASVCAYFDWAPCPPGTQITQADVDALRVKQMTDGSWHMKVSVEADTHNDCRIPELAVCDRVAALAKLGRTMSREAVVAEFLTETYRHHVDTKHILEIVVHDDGPDAAMLDAALAQYEVDGLPAQGARENYADAADLASYLNVVFKTKASKNPKVTKQEPSL